MLQMQRGRAAICIHCGPSATVALSGSLLAYWLAGGGRHEAAYLASIALAAPLLDRVGIPVAAVRFVGRAVFQTQPLHGLVHPVAIGRPFRPHRRQTLASQGRLSRGGPAGR